MVRRSGLRVQPGGREPAEGIVGVHERELRLCLDLAGTAAGAREHLPGDALLEPAGFADGPLRRLGVWTEQESGGGSFPALWRRYRCQGTGVSFPKSFR